MTVLSLAFFAATLGKSAVPADAYSLRWEPAKGAKADFALYVKTLGGDRMEIEANLEQSVIKVSSSGYETATESKGTLLRLSGEEIRDNRTNRTEVEFDSRGAVKSLKKGFADIQNDVWMFVVIRAFVAPEKPVAVGGGWQYEYPAKGKFAGARLSYTLKSVENGMATVNFQMNGVGRERPEIGKGVWKIDAKTGEWREMSCHLKGLFDSGDAGTDISLKRN